MNVFLLKPQELHCAMDALIPDLRRIPREFFWPYIHAVSGKTMDGLIELQ